MKNINWNKGLKQLKNIKMTDTEKDQIFKSVMNYPLPKQSPIKSNWVTYSQIFAFKKHKMAYYTVIASLIVILSGQGIVYASQDSLPGDILYPVKIKVLEPVRSALTLSTEAKAEYESNLATKRLEEAEKLASNNKLDKDTEKRISELVKNHTSALDNDLSRLNKSSKNKKEKVDDIVTNFQAGMNAHSQVLEEILGSNDYIENESEDDSISKTARDSGNKVRQNYRNDDHDLKKYKFKKESVESIINSTTKDIENIKDNRSKAKQNVIENTHKKLDQAKELLKNADDKNEKSDNENAYNDLLDSESSAKEANIFLNVGLKIEDHRNNNKEHNDDSKSESREVRSFLDNND